MWGAAVDIYYCIKDAASVCNAFHLEIMADGVLLSGPLCGRPRSDFAAFAQFSYALRQMWDCMSVSTCLCGFTLLVQLLCLISIALSMMYILMSLCHVLFGHFR